MTTAKNSRELPSEQPEKPAKQPVKQHGFRYCAVCGKKLVKNGKEAGKQRWRCLQCGTARVRPRSDVADRNRQKTYTKYILSKATAADIAKGKYISRRTFDRRYTERFRVAVPRPELQPEAVFVSIDATSLCMGVVAIARSNQRRLFWRYAACEDSATWERVLSAYPNLQAIVSDGQKGIQKAAHLWFGDGIILQRCHFHVKQNLKKKLTMNPQSAAGQDLQLLSQWLSYVKTEDDMALFVGVFHGLQEAYSDFLKERTHHASSANSANTSPTGKRRWSYTHARTRSAYWQIDRLIENDQLFAYITHPELHLPNTTNHIEGGLNARISELMRVHRGMTYERQRQLVDTFLNSKQPPR